MPVLDELILSGLVLWLSFEAVVLSKLKTEIVRSLITSQFQHRK